MEQFGGLPAENQKVWPNFGLLVNNITNSFKLAYNWPILLDFKIRQINIFNQQAS